MDYRDYLDNILGWLVRESEVSLEESITRRRINIGGVNITVRKTGRKDPIRSMRMKRVAARSRSSRRRAMMIYNRSPRARLVRQTLKRFRGTRGKRRRR